MFQPWSLYIACFKFEELPKTKLPHLKNKKTTGHCFTKQFANKALKRVFHLKYACFKAYRQTCSAGGFAITLPCSQKNTVCCLLSCRPYSSLKMNRP